MNISKEIIMDIKKVEGKFILSLLTNRGVHALISYRISHWLWLHKIPLIPMILTRLIQILYSIDIDWRAKIEGGVVIVHGVGLVIGKNAVIKKGCKLYHSVTLGLSHGKNDGFPTLEENVLVGAGAKILGKIVIGKNSKIGANSVVTKNIPENSVAVGIPAQILKTKENICAI
jgi:serine O-acetyltransferase